MKTKKNISGQPAWELASDRTRLAVTQAGGHMAPVVFQLGRKEVSPYSVAPWAREKVPASLPPLIRVLRGDFFCAPFGGNATAFRGEKHPPHGETANADWQLEEMSADARQAQIHLSLPTKVRAGRVDKYLLLRKGETAVYTRNVISGMAGPMCFGNHPMVLFPDRERSGLLSTSRLQRGWVLPGLFENPAEGGYQTLKPGACFQRLDSVPALDGSKADLTSYPARRGFEDLVLLVHEARPDFAWSAVVFPAEGFLWFSLKDPRVLRSTILWHSNGGRHYTPWNGRHTGVMGIEDVTSFFHVGLAESARPNLLTRAGVPTKVDLRADERLVVNSIQGVAAIPRDFGRVRSINSVPGGIRFVDKAGRSTKVRLDLSYLYGA